MSFIPFWNIPSNPMSTTIFCYQHEFRSKLNCETQLIQFVQDLLDKLREGGQTDIIVMDFSKAFDRVSHQRLLLKPHRTGINSSVVISPTDLNFWFLIITKQAYSNILKFLPPKNENFQIKKFLYLFFYISAQNIDFGYSLESPLTSIHNLCF